MSKALDLLKVRMEVLGIEPKRSLGQNFLISDHVIEKIVKAVEGLKPTTLYEVGPGLGALTNLLREKYVSYYLIELDRKFAEFWRSEGLSVIEEDALQVSWDQLPRGAHSNEGGGGGRVLVSNLPYQISSSLVIDRCLDDQQLNGMVLMFQKEVAQRICARHGSGEYGLLTIMAQAFWRVENLLEASGRDFMPPPRVASRVVIFTPKSAPVENRRKFLKFVKAGFAQRRKLLISNLVYGMNLEASQISLAFESLKIGPKVRAEELSVQQMVDLYKVLGYDKS